MADKSCSRCKETKSINEFGIVKGKINPSCKQCKNQDSAKNRAIHRSKINEKARNRYRKDPVKALQIAHKSRAKNPERARCLQLQRRYGITMEQYKEKLLKQGNSCDICKSHVDNFKRPLVVDHCHKTGKVRSLLCDCCNSSFGLMKESISAISNLLEYAKHHSIEDRNVN